MVSLVDVFDRDKKMLALKSIRRLLDRNNAAGVSHIRVTNWDVKRSSTGYLGVIEFSLRVAEGSTKNGISRYRWKENHWVEVEVQETRDESRKGAGT